MVSLAYCGYDRIMSDMLINPGRGKGEPGLAGYGLLLINPSEAQAGLTMAKNLAGQNHFLFNSRLTQIPANKADDTFFMAGPAVGAPMAVLALEKLIALGGTKFIAYGWCGSLYTSLLTGDVLLPTWALSDEGTSAHYPVENRPESCRETKSLLEQGLAARGYNVISGPVWTTDAPYRENRQKIKELGDQGVLGVDMEFAALCAVAAFRNVELTAVMLVSDELFHEQWKPGFGTKAFKKKSRNVLDFLVKFCRDSPDSSG
jgi:uridine phosphorylase